LNLDQVWNPNLHLLNPRKLSKQQKEVVRIDSEGTVRHVQRYVGDLSFNIDLKEFPFDKHLLSIGVVSSHQPNEVAFVVDKTRTGRAKDFSIVDFEIGPGGLKIAPYHFAPEDVELSACAYQFRVKRHSSFYVWKVIFPLLMIVLMSWTVFWIDPALPAAQIGVSTASMLTLIIFQFNLGRLIPRVPYLMTVDLFSLGAILLVFLALLEAISSTTLVRWGREKAALRLDWWSRLVFPGMLFVFAALAFLV
jgi:hypothetical protein